MKTIHCRRLVTTCGIVALAFSVTACNTTKATVDTTVNFFSSTSPGSMFTADGMVAPDQKIKLFAGVSYENLRQEAAAGSGQYVTSLATLYGIPVAKQEEFRRLLQEKHTDFFASDLKADNTAHLKLVAALDRALLADPSLTQ